MLVVGQAVVVWLWWGWGGGGSVGVLAVDAI